MNIKKIELVFENCEVLAFKPYEFGDLVIDKVKTRISRNAVNAIHKFVIAKEIAFYLYKDVNRDIQEFGCPGDDYKISIFDRLIRDDITAIDLTYDDNTTETFYVDWSDEDEYTNYNQRTKILDNGNLVCYISKKIQKEIGKCYNKDNMQEIAKEIYEFGKKYDKDEPINSTIDGLKKDLEEAKKFVDENKQPVAIEEDDGYDQLSEDLEKENEGYE